MFDEHSPTMPVAQPTKRTVKVLDLAESRKTGTEVFIPFSMRLHPWTTIKVSTPT